MAAFDSASVKSQTQRTWYKRTFGRDIVPGVLMGFPAFLGLFTFLILPAIFAFYLSFTNQRLLSPNPTEWVGFRNFDRALALSVLKLEPETDEATGDFVRDENGELVYPRSRSITRTDPKYEGYSEFFNIYVGSQRYVILAKDPTFYRSFLNTFLFAALVLPLQLGLALGMAMLVNQKIPGVTLYRTIYFSPVVTSMVVISIVWGFMYNKDVGLLNQMLDIVTFGKVGPFNWLGSSQSALVAIVLLSAWQGMGLQMIIFLAGLQGIPETLYEAASIDGANTWQKFRNVTLPSLRNTFVFIIIATTISAFALFTQINILTRGGPNDSTTTVMFHIVETGFRQQNIAGGTAMSVIYFVIILLLALFQRRVLSERAS